MQEADDGDTKETGHSAKLKRNNEDIKHLSEEIYIKSEPEENVSEDHRPESDAFMSEVLVKREETYEPECVYIKQEINIDYSPADTHVKNEECQAVIQQAKLDITTSAHGQVNSTHTSSSRSTVKAKPKDDLHCKICNREFKFVYLLERHMFKHTGFECKTCYKKFTQLGQLNAHVLTHTGEKPFQCNTCDKKFNQLSHLIAHVRTHAGKKPFQCVRCDQTFCSSSVLNIHMLTHKGRNPLQCEICDKEFAHLHNFDVHVRTHAGEKPFQCDLCNKNYTHKSSLIAHINTHNGDEEKLYFL